jgi:AraC family transcriptional regulator
MLLLGRHAELINPRWEWRSRVAGLGFANRIGRAKRYVFMAAVASSVPPLHEESLWRCWGACWRQLFGNFNALGLSFEWHELPAGVPLDWDPSFHPGSLELCLNFEGEGEVTFIDRALRIGPWSAAFYRQGSPPLQARRLSGPHRFITVEFSPEFLRRRLPGARVDLHPVIQQILAGETTSGVGEATPLDARRRDLVGSLTRPPVLAAAQPVWFEAKALELACEFFFAQPDTGPLFCRRQQRVARERVARAVEVLTKDLANPPSLDDLGRLAGCSPFYLSRIFSRETGLTVPQFIRERRLERAAALLRDGSHNVTEAAMAVGYSSLSHFSQAFHQKYGCCPGLFPVATSTQSQALRRSEGSASPTGRMKPKVHKASGGVEYIPNPSHKLPGLSRKD